MILLKLFINFFLVGCFSFGGGYAMLPLINQVVVEQEWMTGEQFTDIIAISGMLPGSIGVNTAAFVGYEAGGVLGVIVSTFGIISPSLIIILLIVKFMKSYSNSKIIDQLFYSIKPIIVGLIFSSAIIFFFSMRVATTLSVEIIPFLMMVVLSYILLVRQKLHPIFIILISGVFGIILYS